MTDLETTIPEKDEDPNALDIDALEGFAAGIIEEADDIETARGVLVDLYKENKWKDPDAALSKLEEYGNIIKQKFKDSSVYSSDFLLENAPIDITTLPLKEDDTADDIYDRWKEANLKALDETKDPEYVVARTQLKHDLDVNASYLKRKAYSEDLKETLGPVGAKAYDIMANIGAGVASTVEGLTGQIFKDRLTETTSLDYSGDFSTGLAQGLGSTLGFVAETAINPILGLTAIITQGGSTVYDRFKETYRVTGNWGEATKAASIEAGSQALQIGGEKLVFGKLGTKFGEKLSGKVLDKVPDLGKKIGVSAGQEAFFEGSGQYISNVAENIQEGDPTFKDTKRGVGKSALIGGLVAGGVTGVVETSNSRGTSGNTNIVYEKNSEERAKEFDTYGNTLTPETKQTIGPVHNKPLQSIDSASRDSFDISGISDMTEEELAQLPEGGQEDTVQELGPRTPPATVENYTEDDIEFIPGIQRVGENDTVIPYKVTEEAFKTDDGSTYYKTEEGLTVKENPDGTRELPFEHISYVDPNTAIKIADALLEGGQLVTDPNGQLNLESVLPDGTIITEKVDQVIAAPGAIPIQHSKTQLPNKNTRVRPVSGFGSMITSMNLASSPPKNPSTAGASYGGKFGTGITAQTGYGKRLLDTQGLPNETRELGNSLYYDTYSSKALDEDNQATIEEAGGLRTLIDRYVNGDYNEQGQELNKNRAAVAISNALLEGIVEATANGDTQLQEELQNQFNILAPDIAQTRSFGGQVFQSLTGLTNLEPLNRINKAESDAYNNAITEEALKEDVTTEDILNVEQKIQSIDRETLNTKQQIEQEKLRELQGLNQEALDLDEAISNIEEEAKIKLDSDLESIEAETTDLTQAVTKTEKQATKQFEKEVVALEKEVVKDTLELNKSIEEAISSKEEVEGIKGEIDQTVQSDYAKVESETNKLIKEAVTTEKKNLEDTKKTIRETLKTRLDEANKKYAETKSKVIEDLKKLKERVRRAREEGDLTKLSKLEEQIKNKEQQDVKALERVKKAEEAITTYENDLIASKEEEKKILDTLNELEGGVEIQVTPKGNKRGIKIKTKKSGLDITSLFKKDTPQAPLSALAKGINALVNTTRVGEQLKNSNDSKIKALNDRLKQNQATLEKLKKADPLTLKQKEAVKAAKKRLADLEKAKKSLKLEDYIPKGKKKNYEKYKEKRTNIKSDKSNPKISEAEERLKKLEAERKKAEKLAQKKEEAKNKAKEARKIQAKKEKELNDLEKIAKKYDLKGATKKDIEADILLRKGALTKNTDGLFSTVMVNLIGNGMNAIVATANSITIPVLHGFGYGGLSLYRLIKGSVTGKSYQYPILGYIKGLGDIENGLKRGLSNAKLALKEGRTVKTILSPKELQDHILELKKDRTFEDDTIQARDYINYLKNLKAPTLLNAKQRQAKLDQAVKNNNKVKEEVNAVLKELQAQRLEAIDKGQNKKLKGIDKKITEERSKIDKSNREVGKALALVNEEGTLKDLFKHTLSYIGYKGQKASAVAGAMIRALQAVEAVTSAIAGRAIEQAVYNNEYNKKLDEGVSKEELHNFFLDSKAKYKKAKIDSEAIVKELEGVGKSLTQGQKDILVEELYQKSLDSSLLKDIYKQTGETVLNTPATGVSGFIADLIRLLDDGIEKGTGYRPIRYIVPVANSIANFMEIILRATPLGVLQATPLGGYNKTPLERQLALSTSLTSTAIGGYMLAQFLANLDLPEDERSIDIIGMYSKDKSKVKAFIDGGGTLNSIRIGKTYIPFGETFLAGMLGTIANIVDRKRNGEELDFSPYGIIQMTLLAPLEIGAQASMLRGVSMLSGSIGRATKDLNISPKEFINILNGTVIKGLIPNSGVLRNISRYVDNPVELKTDFLSALVSGIPVVQSALGKPSLNIFGEELPPKDITQSVHRIFSTQNDDLDIRWVVSKQYDLKDVKDILTVKKNGVEVKATDEDKYEIHKIISKDLRNLVRLKRETYGNAARSENVKKDLLNRSAEIIAKGKYLYSLRKFN